MARSGRSPSKREQKGGNTVMTIGRPRVFATVVVTALVFVFAAGALDFQEFFIFLVCPLGGVLFLLYAPQYARVTRIGTDASFALATWGMVYLVFSIIPPCNLTFGVLPAVITTVVLGSAARRKIVLLAPLTALACAWLIYAGAVWALGHFGVDSDGIGSFLIPIVLWNVLMYAALEWDARVPLLHDRRRSAGHCVACGYDLEGIEADAPCPECGAIRRGLLEAPRSARAAGRGSAPP